MNMWPLFGGGVGFAASFTLPTSGCINGSPVEDIPFAVLGAMFGLVISGIDRKFCSPVRVGSTGMVGDQRDQRLRFNIRRLLLAVTVASIVFALFGAIYHQNELAENVSRQKSYRNLRSGIEVSKQGGIAPAEYERLRKELDDRYLEEHGYLPRYP